MGPYTRTLHICDWVERVRASRNCVCSVRECGWCSCDAQPPELCTNTSIYIHQISRFVLISTFWYVPSSLWIVTLMILTARRKASRKTDGAEAKTDAAIEVGSEQAI